MNLNQTIEAARNVLRFKHMAVKTEKSYIHWILRFAYWCKDHPAGDHADKVRDLRGLPDIERNEVMSWAIRVCENADNPVNSKGKHEQLAEAKWIDGLTSRIADLEAKLAESEAERMEQARLNGMGIEREARLLAQFAASQAREKQMRELLPTRTPNGFVSFGKNYAEQEGLFTAGVFGKFKKKYLDDCENALPTDDTALREYVAKELEKADKNRITYANMWGVDWLQKLAEQIRSEKC